MTTDELLEKLPAHIGNGFGDYRWLYLHNEGLHWLASYGVEGNFLCINPNDENPPYDNAFAYGETPNEALQRLYDWCTEHKLF